LRDPNNEKGTTKNEAVDIENFLTERRKTVNDALEQIVAPGNTFPPSIHKAVRYSLLDGGKRIRPILTLSAYELVAGDYSKIVPFSCGIEMVHTYSLIHDDLPAMDNSEFRRGKPSSHKVFGEAIAILAGDALLTLAFDVMTDSELSGALDPSSLLEAIREIAHAAGVQGMIGGQTIDVETQGMSFDLPLLEYIHTHKTGALIVGAIRAGAILGGAGEEQLEALTHYGRTIGLAFQITDDILDIEGSKKTTGKDTGLDEISGKATYPKLLGLEESRVRAQELANRAEEALLVFDDKAEPLKHLARLIVGRIN
jgi:geranylgeranyl diphosphate synthase type II